MQRCRTACLDDLATPRKVLFLGEGAGRMLAELGRRFSAMVVGTVVESSVTMIGQCRATVEAVPGLSTRCEWVVDDVFCWIESGGVNRARYDLIVTCFFLDCFDPPELERLIYGISSRTIRRDGSLRIFPFPRTVPRAGGRRQSFPCSISSSALRPACIPANWPTPLRTCRGRMRREKRQFDWGLLACELWRKL